MAGDQIDGAPASKCGVTQGTKTSALCVPILIGNLSGFQHHALMRFGTQSVQD